MLPTASIIGPRVMTDPIVTLTMSDPGMGRFILLRREYFWDQYIMISPIIEKIGAIG